MSARDIIEAAKAVPGAWFTLGRWAATDTCDLSGMPQADRDYLRVVCDPDHVALMEAVCEAALGTYSAATDAEVNEKFFLAVSGKAEALAAYRAEAKA